MKEMGTCRSVEEVGDGTDEVLRIVDLLQSSSTDFGQWIEFAVVRGSRGSVSCSNNNNHQWAERTLKQPLRTEYHSQIVWWMSKNLSKYPESIWDIQELDFTINGNLKKKINKNK